MFAEKFLFPLISVRLSRGQREGTYTWCPTWWDHRAVAVRIAHLHTAFEATRGPGAAAFLAAHVDAHMRVILDAAKGPLYRCTPTEHHRTPTLPFEPLPDGWITTAPAPAGSHPPADTEPADIAPTVNESAGIGSDGGNEETKDPSGQARKPPPPRRFAHYSVWVQQWLLPVTSVRIAAQQREGTYTWCTRWFAHHGVAIRFALLHAAFEAAATSPDKTAMSNLFLRQIDPTMRQVLDAANGPLHRCAPGEHLHLPALTSTRVPRNWFGVPGARTPVERLGYGPDFRAFAPTAEQGPTP